MKTVQILRNHNTNNTIRPNGNNITNDKDNGVNIYDANIKFFTDDDSKEDVRIEQKKKQKKKHYKDVIREQIQADMELDEKSELMSNNSDLKKPEFVSNLEYDTEQRRLRAEFLNNDDNVHKSEEEEEFLTLKSRDPNASSNASNAHQDAIIQTFGTPDDDNNNDHDLLIDPRGELQGNDANAFLRDFVLHKKWIDPGIPADITHEDDISSDGNGDNKEEDDDEEEVERMDRFESQYNFRFEEQENHPHQQIVSYARGAAHGAHDDSLRRKDESRKNKRQERIQRKSAERKVKEERLRRLKNAKREELQCKIRQIEEAANIHSNASGKKKLDEELLEKMLDGDFDEEKFNQLMEETIYNDEFYGEEDEAWKNDVDVKKGLEGEIDTDDIEYDHDDEPNNHESKSNDQDYEYENAEDQLEEYSNDNEEEEYFEEVGDTEQTELSKKLQAKMLDELYKLDYEDMIGDMPCRFKYKPVEENRFGLTPEEILFAKDSHLNQFVSLKKIVPYREGEDFHPGAKVRRIISLFVEFMFNRSIFLTQLPFKYTEEAQVP